MFHASALAFTLSPQVEITTGLFFIEPETSDAKSVLLKNNAAELKKDD
jgi:hypothetical protein